MDPAKLKVVELRAELATLGLDVKGNKPALVERLRKALGQQGHATSDTTIADTTTEDLDETVAGDVSPPRTRRPGPASRTRRRLSSSEVPTTPTRSSSRRDPEATAKVTAPILEEIAEAEQVPDKEAPEHAPAKEDPPAVTEKSSIASPKKQQTLEKKAEEKAEPPIVAEKPSIVSPVKQQTLEKKTEEKAKSPPAVQSKPQTPEKKVEEVPKSPVQIKQQTPEKKVEEKAKTPVVQSHLQTPEKKVEERAKSPIVIQTKQTPEKKVEEKAKSPVVIQNILQTPEKKVEEKAKSPIVVQAKQQMPEKKVEEKAKSPVVVQSKQQTPEKKAEETIKSPVVTPNKQQTLEKKVEEKVMSPVAIPKPQVVSEVPKVQAPIVKKVEEPAIVTEKQKEKPLEAMETEEPEAEKIKPIENIPKKTVEDRSEVEPMKVDTDNIYDDLEPQPENIKEDESSKKDADESKETPKPDKEEDKPKDVKDDDTKKERRKREKHSRWSSSNQSTDTPAPDSDVQVTGEYISIRDDDDDKSRSRNRRPVKRQREPSPRRKSPVKIPEPEIDPEKVTISWYDSDLNMHIDVPDMNVAVPLMEGGLAHCWAGARASHGINKGKACYEVRVEAMHNPGENCPPGIRFGWSTIGSSLHLGDSNLSWGYENTARKVNNGEFETYGVEIKEGSVIGVYLDLESTPCTIMYTVNGESQGNAFEFEKSVLEDAALYPHILSRNCCVKVNFGYEKYGLLTKTKVVKRQIEVPVEAASEAKIEVKEKTEEKKDGDEKYDPMKCSDDEQDIIEDKPKDVGEKTVTDEEKVADGSEKMEVEQSESKETTENKDAVASKPNTMIRIEADIEIDGEEIKMLDGYELIGKLVKDLLVLGPQRPTKDEPCEVIMMCGLPGCGKTYWAQKYAIDHSEKRFNILGTSALIEKMKIDCKGFKSQFTGKWPMLISKITKNIVKLIDIAQNRRRNYILDQTNVYPSTQRRKMREFTDYKRTAVVIVPDEATYQERKKLREEKDGKDVPDDAVFDMKANFVLPEKCTWMEEVLFTELNEEDSKKILEKYNKEGHSAGFGNSGRSRSGGRSRSSSGAPSGSKRPRFDNGSMDRGRRGGPDRGRHGSGPIHNRNDNRREGGGRWEGRPGGRGGMWGGNNWGGPRDHPPFGGRNQGYNNRDQGYNRDHHHHPYGRDNRSRDGPPSGPFRGGNDRWGNRGGQGRDNRGGGSSVAGSEGRGRGTIDHNRGERSDRGGGKGGWTGGQHRGGGSVGGAPRSQIQNPGRNQSRQNGQSGRGGQGGSDNQGGTWGHQQQNTGGHWNQQQSGGNWMHGGWPAAANWSNWGGGGGHWGKFPGSGQQAGGQQQANPQNQQWGNNQWGQWQQQQQQQQQPYWQQWSAQQQKDNAAKALPGATETTGTGDQGGSATAPQAVANPQMWAQYHFAQQQNFNANVPPGGAVNSEKK